MPNTYYIDGGCIHGITNTKIKGYQRVVIETDSESESESELSDALSRKRKQPQKSDIPLDSPDHIIKKAISNERTEIITDLTSKSNRKYLDE